MERRPGKQGKASSSYSSKALCAPAGAESLPPREVMMMFSDRGNEGIFLPLLRKYVEGKSLIKKQSSQWGNGTEVFLPSCWLFILLSSLLPRPGYINQGQKMFASGHQSIREINQCHICKKAFFFSLRRNKCRIC